MEVIKDNIGLFLILIVIAIAIVLYSAWDLNRTAKRLKIQKKRLIKDKFNLEAEKLKFQLQPHTLNNLLAELKATAGRLNRGMESLSDTLEYIIYKGDSHFVSVKDEIDFIEKFLSLNDLFISEIDSIKLHTIMVEQNSVHYNNPSVPHLVTGYFIENAFKHGDKKHPDFLTISLKLTDEEFEINVKNKLGKKNMVKAGGIGLKNMEERLKLMCAGKFSLQYQEIEDEFHSNLKLKLT